MDKTNHFNYTQYNPTDTSLMIQSIYFLIPTMLGLFVMVASIATVGEAVCFCLFSSLFYVKNT